MTSASSSAIEVFIIAALTADGYLGQHGNHSSLDWRSKEDGQFFVSKTLEAGAVVMGSTTFATMSRPMPRRKHYVLTSDQSKYAEYDPTVVLGLTESPEGVVRRAAQDGFSQLAVCGGSSVYTQFIKSGLVSRLFLTYEPILFGQGITLFDQPLEQQLHLTKVHDLSDQTKVFEYSL